MMTAIVVFSLFLAEAGGRKMKHMGFDGKIRKGISLLLAFMLVFLSVPGAWAADGAADPLKPDDLSYDHENIILHKCSDMTGKSTDILWCGV